VLELVGLERSLVDQPVGQDGSNLSHGERALLAIARVLLRRSSVVVMDEPTANIDPETDAQLQKLIRTEFRDATLITIAHRLHTVADFDRILVMDAGECKEYDSPAALLRIEGGYFSSMVSALGPDAAATIREKAAAAEARNGNGEDGAAS